MLSFAASGGGKNRPRVSGAAISRPVVVALLLLGRQPRGNQNVGRPHGERLPRRGPRKLFSLRTVTH